MGSVSLSWSSVSLAPDDADDVQTVEATCSFSLSGCPSGSTFSSAATKIKIGVIYYDADNIAIGTDGNPLPSGTPYSYYQEVKRTSGSGASTLTLTAQQVNHAAGTVAGAHKPSNAVNAAYRYYTHAEYASACSGCTGGEYGPVGGLGYIAFTQGGGGGGD